LAETLGEHITGIRTALGWSKSRLARKAGVSPSIICDLESGKNENPGLKTLLKISRALGISLSELCRTKSKDGT